MPARRAPVYASMRMTHARYGAFRARLEAAKREALVEARETGRRVARESYHHKYATGPKPSTKQSINYRTDAKNLLLIYVGTLRGVFKEYGTKVRKNRGQQKAEPYLRPGMAAAIAVIIPAVRRRAPKAGRL